MVVVALGAAVAFGVGVPILRTTDHLAAQLLGILVTAASGLIATLGSVALLIATFPGLARSTPVTDVTPPAAGPDKPSH